MQLTDHSSARSQRFSLSVSSSLLFVSFSLLAPAFGLEYYVGFVRRVLIVAIAATSLNFILGFGGMVALGHAGFIGVGAYTVVALSDAGVLSGWLFRRLDPLPPRKRAARVGLPNHSSGGTCKVVPAIAANDWGKRAVQGRSSSGIKRAVAIIF